MQLISKIYTSGLIPSDNGLRRMRVVLSNLMALFTFPLLTFYVFSLYNDGHNIASIVLAISSLSMLGSFILNVKRQFTAASYLILFTTNCVVTYTICIYGTEGNVQVFYPILVVFVFISLDKTLERIIFVLIIILSCFISFLYVDTQVTEILERTFEYDYYLNVGFAILICGILSHMVMKNLNQHNTNLIQTIAALESKNSRIKEQNEEMDLFTSMASHDLKTPVRTIMSFLGLLQKQGKITDDKSKEYLDFAISGTDQLNTLVNGISSFKILENKSLKTSYKKTDKILDQVIMTLAIKENPTIKIIRSKLPNLKMNSVHLHHIFQNLIENGLKYNDSQVKQIKISSTTRDNVVEIEISDNGIGIAQDYLEYVFEPFKKLHGSEKYQSAGLGLSICKKLVTMYQGDIKAKATDSGTAMTIYLPIDLLKSHNT